jgi:hypothetical protein
MSVLGNNCAVPNAVEYRPWYFWLMTVSTRRQIDVADGELHADFVRSAW